MTGLLNEIPTFEAERLVLQPLRSEHTNFVFQHFSDPRVTRYLLDEPPVTEYSQAEEIVHFYSDAAHKNYNRWVIAQKSDGQPMGTCGYHKWDRRHFRAEIGYDLNPAFWGKSYMTDALKVVISYGFDHMQLNRIDALVYIENERSTRLLQRLGFKQEGLLRDYFFLNGKYYDHYIFSLLKKEW